MCRGCYLLVPSSSFLATVHCSIFSHSCRLEAVFFTLHSCHIYDHIGYYWTYLAILEALYANDTVQNSPEGL